MSPHRSSRGPRLDAALAALAVVFRGATAHPDESNCECHWGSPEELAQLKVPDVELDPDLLHRTWAATDWNDHAAVLRRILPQLATTLVNGRIEAWIGLDKVGQSLARGEWQHWPAEQTRAVREFLEAWWSHTLSEPQPAVRPYEVFAFCTVASGDLEAWLTIWQATTHPVAVQHLAEAIAHWADDLWDDELPWDTLETHEQRQAVLTDLTSWLVRNAGARLREHGTLLELLNQARPLGIRTPAGQEEPPWATEQR